MSCCMPTCITAILFYLDAASSHALSRSHPGYKIKKAIYIRRITVCALKPQWHKNMTHLCKPKSNAARVLSQQLNLHGREHMGVGAFKLSGWADIYSTAKTMFDLCGKYKVVSSAVSLASEPRSASSHWLKQLLIKALKVLWPPSVPENSSFLMWNPGHCSWKRQRGTPRVNMLLQNVLKPASYCQRWYQFLTLFLWAPKVGVAKEQLRSRVFTLACSEQASNTYAAADGDDEWQYNTETVVVTAAWIQLLSCCEGLFRGKLLWAH